MVNLPNSYLSTHSVLVMFHESSYMSSVFARVTKRVAEASGVIAFLI